MNAPTKEVSMKRLIVVGIVVAGFVFAAVAQAQYPRTFTTPIWFHTNAR